MSQLIVPGGSSINIPEGNISQVVDLNMALLGMEPAHAFIGGKLEPGGMRIKLNSIGRFYFSPDNATRVLDVLQISEKSYFKFFYPSWGTILASDSSENGNPYLVNRIGTSLVIHLLVYPKAAASTEEAVLQIGNTFYPNTTTDKSNLISISYLNNLYTVRLYDNNGNFIGGANSGTTSTNQWYLLSVYLLSSRYSLYHNFYFHVTTFNLNNSVINTTGANITILKSNFSAAAPVHLTIASDVHSLGYNNHVNGYVGMVLTGFGVDGLSTSFYDNYLSTVSAKLFSDLVFIGIKA